MSDRNFDKRVVERNVARKVISKKEVEKRLESLEDCSDLCVELETKFLRKVQSEKTA